MSWYLSWLAFASHSTATFHDLLIQACNYLSLALSSSSGFLTCEFTKINLAAAISCYFRAKKSSTRKQPFTALQMRTSLQEMTFGAEELLQLRKTNLHLLGELFQHLPFKP